jgi:two-component system OmpR family sensor kinase
VNLSAGLWLLLGLGLGALCGGWLVARRLLPRIRRLEAGSERIAQLESARKQFIATASHELRTPIFSLGGFVELLEDEDLDPATRRRFLGHVSEQLERLRKLSVDLLDLSRLEAGALELRPEEVDLGELTRSVAAEFEPALAAHDARVELHLRRPLEIVCDPVRVAQILRILIDNALSHTEAGTQILISTGRGEGRVHVAVQDDGAGIPADHLSRIFEPFYTGDAVHGSGLGLAIASELAERMGGRLTVTSKPGSTTFALLLEG